MMYLVGSTDVLQAWFSYPLSSHSHAIHGFAALFFSGRYEFIYFSLWWVFVVVQASLAAVSMGCSSLLSPWWLLLLWGVRALWHAGSRSHGSGLSCRSPEVWSTDFAIGAQGLSCSVGGIFMGQAHPCLIHTGWWILYHSTAGKPHLITFVEERKTWPLDQSPTCLGCCVLTGSSVTFPRGRKHSLHTKLCCSEGRMLGVKGNHSSGLCLFSDIFAPSMCWNFSSELPDSHRGTLDCGW